MYFHNWLTYVICTMISIRAFHFFHYLSLCVYKTVLQKAFTLSSSNHHLPFAWPSCERYVQVTKSLYVTKPREKNKINLCIMNPISFEKGFKQIKSNVPPPTHPQITRTKDNKGQCKESAWKTDIWNTCLEHQFSCHLECQHPLWECLGSQVLPPPFILASCYCF